MNFEIINFGCRLNSYESELIRELFKKNNIVLDENKKVIIFNSCCVTKQAENQLCQAIRKARREYKDRAIIGVVGCAVQVNYQKYQKMKEIDFLIGNGAKLDINNYKNFRNNKLVVNNIFENNSQATELITGFEGRVRAFISIQNGCDNRCTFCLTRLARGYSVSTPSSQIIEQVKILVDNCFREIVLTGVDISDYGKRLDENINLGLLIKKILKETAVERLRISSIDIAKLNNDLMNVFYNDKRLMPHIHLSLQSGDNEILKKMARRHSREETIEKCFQLKKYRPDIIFGADFIAGFPTETEQQHQNSVDIIKQIPIIFGHIFPYSERPETPASKLPQLNKVIRKERARQLRETANENLQRLKKELAGTRQKVLVESESTGRLENYLQIKLNGDFKDKIGEIVEIII